MMKRGQVYLIAALVIVGLVAGLTTVYNYAKSKPEDQSTFDLSAELDYESAKVVETGVLNPSENPNTNLEELADYFSLHNPDTDFIIFLYDGTQIKKIEYDSTQRGSISLSPGTKIDISKLQGTVKNSLTLVGNTATFIIDGKTYTATLTPGQSYYLIVKRDREEETFIDQPQEEKKFECSDELDNDKDGLKDAQDPGCSKNYEFYNSENYDPTRNREFNPTNSISDWCIQVRAICSANENSESECQSLQYKCESTSCVIGSVFECEFDGFSYTGCLSGLQSCGSLDQS